MDDEDDVILEIYLYDDVVGVPYSLGVVKDALGWVSEANVQYMADSRPDRIFFFHVRRGKMGRTWTT